MHILWKELKTALQNSLSPSGFALWIEPLQADSGPDAELVLICPNAFACRWVQNHYLPLIRQKLKEIAAAPVAVKLTVGTPPSRKPSSPLLTPAALPLLADKCGSRTLKQDFTFERFVVGPCNRLAYHASQALAVNDTFYNGILFLTSEPGLGKSHLSQAVGNFLKQTSPCTQILYVTAEDFANDMVRSLKSGQMAAFKKRYRSTCDILLLEEVQFLSGKEKIQSEICYTLDSLLDQRKRVVFTSCHLPGEISQLSQELRSRLTGGVITPIEPPDFATRVHILSRKAGERGVSAPARVVEYLAEHLSGDVRRLESALDCLLARSVLLSEPLTMRLAQEVLQDLKAVPRGLSVAKIQKIVGDYYQVSIKELLGRSRQKRVVRARQMALYFCRLYTQKTTMELGRLFQRSHAAVVHALQTLERDRRTLTRVAQEVTFLEEKMAQAYIRGKVNMAPTLHTDA